MTFQTTQYLDEKKILEHIPLLDINPSDLGSSDTYNELKILETYMKLPTDVKVLVYKAALQLAIIGYGNKNYGFIRVNEKEIITLSDLFTKYNIKFVEKQNSNSALNRNKTICSNNEMKSNTNK